MPSFGWLFKKKKLSDAADRSIRRGNRKADPSDNGRKREGVQN